MGMETSPTVDAKHEGDHGVKVLATIPVDANSAESDDHTHIKINMLASLLADSGDRREFIWFSSRTFLVSISGRTGIFYERKWFPNGSRTRTTTDCLDGVSILKLPFFCGALYAFVSNNISTRFKPSPTRLFQSSRTNAEESFSFHVLH